MRGRFFIPMHEQQVFQNMGLLKGESYTVAEELSRREGVRLRVQACRGRVCMSGYGVGCAVAG
ncbi:hypothetical protein DRN76_04855 [Methanosarcinales archaeon]|nr:MAG: hypothetical protein DRN76_04855 [Methanosarcinales archaeon]